jgi:hypothetical protein
MEHQTPDERVRANHAAGRPKVLRAGGLAAVSWLAAFIGFKQSWPFLTYAGMAIFLAASVILAVTIFRVITLKERPRG